MIYTFIEVMNMPRQARTKSESGYYHILLRGIGQQNIFEDQQDRQKFIQILGRYKKEMNYQLIAYCLMGNHVHLLLQDVDRCLDVTMKKIAGSYAFYFNWKYERVGHLFQDRFKSEPVDDDAYFLTVLRYIHQNPYKAGISQIADYPWSSYKNYIEDCGIVDTEMALALLNGKSNFVQFINETDERKCLDVEFNKRLTDEKAIQIIKSVAKIKNVQDLQTIDKATRNNVMRALKSQGLSVRQISRLTVPLTKFSPPDKVYKLLHKKITKTIEINILVC